VGQTHFAVTLDAVEVLLLDLGREIVYLGLDLVHELFSRNGTHFELILEAFDGRYVVETQLVALEESDCVEWQGAQHLRHDQHTRLLLLGKVVAVLVLNFDYFVGELLLADCNAVFDDVDLLELVVEEGILVHGGHDVHVFVGQQDVQVDHAHLRLAVGFVVQHAGLHLTLLARAREVGVHHDFHPQRLVGVEPRDLNLARVFVQDVAELVVHLAFLTCAHFECHVSDLLATQRSEYFVMHDFRVFIIFEVVEFSSCPLTN